MSLLKALIANPSKLHNLVCFSAVSVNPYRSVSHSNQYSHEVKNFLNPAFLAWKSSTPLNNALLPPTGATISSRGVHQSATVMAIGSSVSPGAQKLKVKHEPSNKRFVIRAGTFGFEKAVLDYRETRPGVLDMYHTEVPAKLRGRAIASLLAKTAFDYVVEKDLKMKLTCPYLQDYLAKHPEEKYRQRVVE